MPAWGVSVLNSSVPPRKLFEILQVFYRTSLPYLPVAVVEAGSDVPSPDQIKGFVSRTLVNAALTDLERAPDDPIGIPPDIMLVGEVPSELLIELSQADEIPVFNTDGHLSGSWNAAELLKAAGIFHESRELSSRKEDGKAARDPEGPPRAQADRLCRLILGEINRPLFVADLRGATLFYNSLFEEDVLNSKQLKKSIRLTENYIQELSRTLLAEAVANGRDLEDDDFQAVTFLSELKLEVEMKPLRSAGALLGYLYIFSTRNAFAARDHALNLLHSGQNFEEIIDAIEAEVILSVLEGAGRNISHTATALKLKRTTLQNRIKRLGLEKKLEAGNAGPIRRRSRKPESPPSDAPPTASRKKATERKKTTTRKKASSPLRKKRTPKKPTVQRKRAKS